MKKNLNEGNQYTILYCVCENFCGSILLRFRQGPELNYGTGSATANSYVSYDSATLVTYVTSDSFVYKN